MLSEVLLFAVVNGLVLTVNLSPSRLFLLLISSIIFLKAYKYILNYD